jgi:hypothetical protein
LLWQDRHGQLQQSRHVHDHGHDDHHDEPASLLLFFGHKALSQHNANSTESDQSTWHNPQAARSCLFAD